MTFTIDKHLAFIINNFDDIEALNTIYERAKTKLPEIVNTLVTESIFELKSSFQQEKNLIITTENDCISWYDHRAYDIDSEVGLAFQYDLINWETLTGKSVDDYPAFTLLFKPKGKNKNERKVDCEKCERIFHRIKEEEYDQYGWASVHDYSLKYFINIGKLKDPEDLKTNIQEACIEFTDNFLPSYEEYFQK